YREDTNPLTDAPSLRVLRFARIEVEDMMQWVSLVLNCLADGKLDQNESEWLKYLNHLIQAAGKLDGSAPASDTAAERRFSATPSRFDPVPKRDERFLDLWNQGVNAEAFLYDDAFPAKAKALMMLFKRLREIDVPEMMASIITETKGKPWGYYREMTRQLWD